MPEYAQEEGASKGFEVLRLETKNRNTVTALERKRAILRRVSVLRLERQFALFIPRARKAELSLSYALSRQE
jgi:hypothetical protein